MEDSTDAKTLNYPIIVNSELSDDLQEEAVEILVNAYEKHFSHLETAAKTAKDAFDTRFGSSWNCFIGNFSFTIEHQEGDGLLYVFLNANIGALLFKC
ncbi:hypothetical protein RCL1_002136 [Eukaryota sp. TZLM3-RCL]